jgi:CheY-like chemotaxis protein
MSGQRPTAANHILVVDDNEDIHVAIRKTLTPNQTCDHHGLAERERVLFGVAETMSPVLTQMNFLIDSAYQGEEAVEMVRTAKTRYFMAIVDMRMPPGIDGLETIKRLWSHAPYLFTVICSAYSDHGWDDIIRRLGPASNLLILRKPFETIEIRQIATAVASMYSSLSAIGASVGVLEAELEHCEARFERAQSQLGALLATSAGPVVLADERDTITNANDPAGALWQCAASDLIGRPVADILTLDGERGVARRVGGEIPVAVTSARHPLNGGGSFVRVFRIASG